MPLHILIADDSATNRLLFSMTAARMGHSADAVASGREATTLFSLHEYDLVFIDLQMPQISGLTTAQQLQLHNPRHIPLYAISGYIDKETELRALSAGFRGCFVKPLDREKIMQAALESGLGDKLPAAAPQETAHGVPARLLTTYAQELRTRAAACERYWQDGDIPALRREAHTLRALANMLKTADVAAAAAQVEETPDVPRGMLLSLLHAATQRETQERDEERLRALCRACLYAAASIERRPPAGS